MFPDRMNRVASLLREEISLILNQHCETISRLTGGILVTVTTVEVKRNLESANVYYSWTQSGGGGGAGEDLNAKIQQALLTLAPDISQELYRRVRLKRSPKIHFLYDRSLESADRIYGILEQIHCEKQTKNKGTVIARPASGGARQSQKGRAHGPRQQ